MSLDFDRRLRLVERRILSLGNSHQVELAAHRSTLSLLRDDDPNPLTIPQRPTILKELRLGHDLEPA